MARPRVYVHVAELPDGTLRRVESGGREVHGLHVHKVRDGYDAYYTYDPSTGKRRHLGADLARAIRIVRSEPEPLPEWADPDPFTPEQAARHEAGLPAPSREKLSDCVQFWREWKTEQEREPEYLAETERNFKELIAVVGDKSANQITKADFVQFERHLNRNAESNDWYARRIKSLRAIFNLCIRKDTLPLPDGLAKWLAAIESRPVVPDATNKKALPSEIFKAMIGICERWAEIDVEAMPKETQADKARRNRAHDRKRNAVQYLAILKLACQTGFGSKDICRLEWSHLHLDGKAPYADFPRTKTEWRTGVAVPRVIPLLPATVEALKAWRAYESPNGYVFRNSQRGQWIHDQVSRNFAVIKKASKHDSFWSFKHLRNIPGNVGRDAKLVDWIAEATLGHTPNTLLGKRYIDDPQAKMLLPLVKAIGARYFAGK